MNKHKRYEILTRLRAENPTPTTELHYQSTFELLIAVILSAQATDVGVNKATARLYAVANTPEAILALGETGLKQYIKTIGLFNAKAANVIKTCRQLVEQHNSVVPDNRRDLEALPVLAARPPMWYSIPLLANPPWPWIRIFSGSPTALTLPLAKMCWRWRKNS